MEILNAHVQFQIDWQTHQGDKSLHVVAVHISPGMDYGTRHKWALY